MTSGVVNQAANAFQKAKINPFDEDIINEPREVTFSVKGLNELALRELINAFATLESTPLPRGLVAAPKAQLVISPSRGYGKSHLLGRLFQVLDDRATQIYLRPFQDPQKVWHSILLLTVQELERTDNPGEESDKNPLQIEAFARGVLAHLVADYIDQGDVQNYEYAKEAVKLLREQPLAVLRITTESGDWENWIKSIYENPTAFSKLKNKLKQRLADKTGTVSVLGGRESAWLKMLYSYAFSPKGSEKRDVVLKWLRAEPLEDEEVELLQITKADNEAKGEMSAAEINDLSSRRLQGLCALAGFYRPFLFCFDQTEFYSSDEALVKIFGHVMQKLYAEFSNHLTVVTANQNNWERDLAPKFESPNQDRLSKPILLQGVNAEQARELIRNRLESIQLDYRDVEQFCGNGWLQKQFASSTPAARQILSAAADRFRALQGLPTTNNETKPLAPKGAHPLEALLKTKINEIRTKRPLQAYNQDVLMWWTQELAKDATPWQVIKDSENNYFNTRWQRDQRIACFAFEGGDNCKRWEAIAKEAIRLAPARDSKQAIILRTPDLPKLPKATWKKIKAIISDAEKSGLRIHVLSLDQVCEMYAARDLFSDAYQGNIDFKPHDVMAWLRERLKKQIENLVVATTKPPSEPSTPVPSTLSAQQLKQVETFVEKKRFVAIEAVLKELNAGDMRQAVLNSISACTSIKAHPGPKTILLQWRVKSSL